MLKKLLTASAVSAGLVAGVVAAPAMAADAPTAAGPTVKVSASDVTLKSSGLTTFTITAKLSRALTSSETAVVIVGPDDAASADDLLYVTPTGTGTTLSAKITADATAPAGLWDTEVDVYQKPASEGDAPIASGWTTFDVKLPTHNVVNASPEPAAHGTPITVKGTLTHYSPTAKKYTAYKAKTIDIYFDPTGSAPRTKVATVTTGSTGTYSKTFTASSSGVWSTQFAGTSSYAAVRSNGDYVPVVTRKTALTANATPEPVKKGGTVTVVGRLTHATTASGKLTYTSYKDKTLTISFNPTGPQGAKVVGTVTTNSKGEYSKKFTQSVDGTWWVSFAGTSNYAAALKGDHVDVK
jgi:hypothetical protein